MPMGRYRGSRIDADLPRGARSCIEISVLGNRLDRVIDRHLRVGKIDKIDFFMRAHVRRLLPGVESACYAHMTGPVPSLFGRVSVALQCMWSRGQAPPESRVRHLLLPWLAPVGPP